MNFENILALAIYASIAAIIWRLVKKFVPASYRHKVELAWWGVRHLAWGTIRQDRFAKLGAYMVVVGSLSMIFFGGTTAEAVPVAPMAAIPQPQQPAVPPPPALNTDDGLQRACKINCPPAEPPPSESGVTTVTHTFHASPAPAQDAPAEQSNPN